MTKSDDQSNPFPGLMAALSNPIEVRGTWFNGKVVKIDGYKFIECRFDNCQLNVSSTNIHLERCHIDNSTTISWHGEIVKALRLFNSRNNWIYKEMPDFAPDLHADGTVTIAD